MIDLKAFRKANGLTQADVAQYLSVSAPFITRVESGLNKLPEDKLQKLINNDRGWDVSYLMNNVSNGDHIHQNGGRGNIGKITYDSETEALKRENEMLRRQLTEALKRNQEYWELIRELTTKK